VGFDRVVLRKEDDLRGMRHEEQLLVADGRRAEVDVVN
jgi:hypothetical protein